MGKVVGIFVIALLIAGTAQGATKPKPWSWTPASAILSLEKTNPALWGEKGTIDVSKCAGKGKVVAKRYLSFACAAVFKPQSISGTPVKATLFVKVRPFGKGQPCVSTKSLAAIPKACLGTGARTTDDPDKARAAMGVFLGKQMGTSFPYQGPTGCLGYGSGYFECWYGANDSADPVNGRATVIMSTQPVVTITKPFSG